MRVRRRRATLYSLLLGVANTTVGLWTVSRTGHVGSVGLVWGGLGLATTVAVPVYLLLGWRLLAPMPIVAVFVWGFYLSEGAPAPGEPFVGYVLLWPALVIGALVLAGIEYVIRSQSGDFPPQSRAN